MTWLLLVPCNRYFHISSQKCLACNVTHPHIPITASDQAAAPNPLSWASQNSVRSQWDN